MQIMKDFEQDLASVLDEPGVRKACIRLLLVLMILIFAASVIVAADDEHPPAAVPTGSTAPDGP